MNILLIRPRLENGGAAKSILLLAQELSIRGHSIIIATHSGEQLETARKLKIRVYLLPLYPTSVSNYLRATIGLLRVIRQENIDILHSHHRFSNLICRTLSIFTGIPIISTVHEFKFTRAWLTRWGLGHDIITFSSALKKHLITHYHVTSHTIHLIRVGIPLETPAANDVIRAKHKLNVQTEKVAMGCIARLSEEKGVHILLQALSHAKGRGYEFHCYLVGDGPQKAYLEELVDTLELNEVVHFLGYQTAIPEIIANLDFLVLPSLSEGLGLVILEGFNQAKPTIGSRVGGIPEIIKNGYNGLLVPPNDPIALADAIIRLLENPTLAKQLGQVGKEETIRDFSFKNMINQIEQIYQIAITKARNKTI